MASPANNQVAHTTQKKYRSINADTKLRRRVRTENHDVPQEVGQHEGYDNRCNFGNPRVDAHYGSRADNRDG